MPENTPRLTVRDERTGQNYQLPIEDESINALDLRQIKAQPDDFGLLSYDPGFMNTAPCKSAITYIDGDVGILEYRGYPIEQLAGRVGFLDIAYLLVHGDLPTAEQSASWARAIAAQATVPDGLAALIESFPRDSHPMAILLAAVGALGAYHPEAKNIRDPNLRMQAAIRAIGCTPTLAGMIYRHITGRSVRLPAPTGQYTRDFTTYLFGATPDYEPPIALVDAIDMLLVLHADHEQNCGTNAVRGVGSSLCDPYSAWAGGVAALYGPAHGGANEAVMRMLHEVGSVDRVPDTVERVKSGEMRLMGFGHRVYKNYDPRARMIKETALRVFEVTGTNPLLEVAIALEKVALEDDYFIRRKLYPNVDFYSGLIYEALGLPMTYFTVMFAVARMVGWAAQWLEMMEDDKLPIARPRQLYVGARGRSLPPG